MLGVILGILLLFVLPVAVIGTILMLVRGTRSWQGWCSSTGIIIAIYLVGVATAYLMTKDGSLTSRPQSRATPPTAEITPKPNVQPSPSSTTTPAGQPAQPVQVAPQPDTSSPQAQPPTASKPTPTSATTQPPSTPVQQNPVATQPERPTSAPPPAAEPQPTIPSTTPNPVPPSPPAIQPTPAPTPPEPTQAPTTQIPTTSPVTQPASAAGSGPNGESIKGTTNTKGEKVYYQSAYPSFDKVIAERWFFTEDEAKKAGYKLAS